MERELAKNRELTAAMVAAMPDGVILFDMDGKVIAVNPAIEKISGYTSDELVQRNAADVVAKSVKPEDQEKIMGARKMALEGKVPGPVSVTMITKGGQEIPVSYDFAFIKDAQGKSIYILATHKNLTEFKRAEEERNERVRDLDFLSKVTMEIVELPLEKDIYKFAAEKLQQLVGDSIIAVSAYDKAANSLHTRALLGLGKYTDSVVKMVGASPFAMSFKVTYSEEMSKMTTSKLTKIPEGLYGASFGQVPRVVCQTIEKLLNVGDVYGIGLRREKQLFGAVVIYTRRGTELRQGIIETFVNQVSVILERNLINEKRVGAETTALAAQMADSTIAAMADTVVLIDMEGKIISFNPAFEKHTGYERNEWIGHNVLELITALIRNPNDIKSALVNLQPILAEKHSSLQYTMTRKDGQKFFTACTVAFIRNEKGNPAAMVFTIKDITEIKQTQDLLQQERVMSNSIIDLNPYGIQIFDAEGHHVRANQAFSNMFQSVPPTDYCFFDDPIIVKAGLHEARQALKEGKTYVVPEEWYNAHWLYPELPDKLSCFRSTVFPIMNADGKMEHFVAMFEDITERKRAQDRLEKINACMFSLGTDFVTNVNRLTALCGELLGATCALYNRLEGNMLCSSGQWHTPPDYAPQDRPDGHICYDVIRQGGEHILVIRNLAATPYATSDANVTKYGLQTYIGQMVRCAGEPVGSLCAVFQQDMEPTDDDRRVLGIIASSISIEEERKRAQERLERFNRVAVGQELEMVRLEEEVNALREKSGLPGKYETPEKIKKLNESIAKV